MIEETVMDKIFAIANHLLVKVTVKGDMNLDIKMKVPKCRS